MKLGEQIALTDTDIEYKYGVLDRFLVKDIKRYQELGHDNYTIGRLVKRPSKMVTRVLYKLKKAKMKKEGLA